MRTAPLAILALCASFSLVGGIAADRWGDVQVAKQVTDMVQHGADPQAARCAIYGNTYVNGMNWIPNPICQKVAETKNE